MMREPFLFFLRIDLVEIRNSFSIRNQIYAGGR